MKYSFFPLRTSHPIETSEGLSRRTLAVGRISCCITTVPRSCTPCGSGSTTLNTTFRALAIRPRPGDPNNSTVINDSSDCNSGRCHPPLFQKYTIHPPECNILPFGNPLLIVGVISCEMSSSSSTETEPDELLSR